MITQEELGAPQVRFETVRQSNQAHYHELEKLQRQFVGKFPKIRIPLLTLSSCTQHERLIHLIRAWGCDSPPRNKESKNAVLARLTLKNRIGRTSESVTKVKMLFIGQNGDGLKQTAGAIWLKTSRPFAGK